MLSHLNSALLGPPHPKPSALFLQSAAQTNFYNTQQRQFPSGLLTATEKMSTPLIMQALDPKDVEILPCTSISSTLKATEEPTDQTPPDMESLCTEFDSFNYIDHQEPIFDSQYKSVLLLDDNEQLLIASERQFVTTLNIPPETKIKVVSIFGNTGEGKSHTLNNAFFDGDEIFRTSNSQTSCTLGVWAYYNARLAVLFLDTEGLLGVTNSENRRMRLLLKVLAVSDVVIYRTRAERLHRDMYTFLGGASEAYRQHFTAALKQILTRHGATELSTSKMGPALVIFHETRYTNTLNASADVTKSAEDIIRSYFHTLNLSYDGFSAIKYVGCETKDKPISYRELELAVQKEIESSAVRSARYAKYIYLTIKGLNAKFQNKLTESSPKLYLPAYFTCPEKCLSCGISCTLSMGHNIDEDDEDSEKKGHTNNTNNCQLQHQYKNFIYLCKVCYNNGVKQVVQSSYEAQNPIWNSLQSVWSGYNLECPKCGVIYQSRQHWYGNKDPREEAVIVDIVHVWPGDKYCVQDRSVYTAQNSAQKVLDQMTNLSNVVASVGHQPTKLISDWVTDQIAPIYWRPNHEINDCFKCKIPFPNNASKHHCRNCGEGFCESCSSKQQPVPDRGWSDNVRVCDFCYKEPAPPDLLVIPTTVPLPSVGGNGNTGTGEAVLARRIGESVFNSISAVKSVLDIPKDFIKDTVRPHYWTPDNECGACVVCSKPFGTGRQLHHCRDCGRGVCDNCSLARRPVPLRGWDTPVRVCDNCLLL